MGILNRRTFLGSTARMSSAAGLLAAAGKAQAPQTSIRRPDRFDDNSLIMERKPFTWPGGKTLAIWIIPNVESFIFNPDAGTPGSPRGDENVFNFSWKEYGMRVGLWRIADVMDEANIRATVALNAGVCDVFPKAITEMTKRGWEMMGHNLTNSRYLRDYPADKERDVIRTTLKVIDQATGKKTIGWLGSGLWENFNTLDTLAEEGVRYTGDWNNEDIPYRMKVKTGEMYALNYGNAINDITFFGKGHTGEEYYQLVVDQFDTLHAESQK